MPRKRRSGPKAAAKSPVSPKPEEEEEKKKASAPPATSTPAPAATSSPAPEAPPKLAFKKMAESILAVAGNGASAVEVFPKLHDLMENLINEQKALSLVAKASQEPEVRLQACCDLLEAMGELSVDCSCVSIADFGCQGLGLKAARSLARHEVVLRIPREAIMTSDDAVESEIGDFLKMDPVCMAMPPISLALFLLQERFKGADSKWAPYIQSLPQQFSGCLYMSIPEFNMLKGSPVQEKVALDFRRMCRQYAIFILQLERCKEAENVGFRNQFTWEDFRWSLSTVFSRNNPIPKNEGGCAIGLVPVWDMGNHEFGEITTDFDVEKQHLIFHAMRDFSKDEQLVFHYGNRSNCDLFMYCGFTVPDNPFERFPLKLGVSAKDPLYEKRMQLLKKYCLDNSDGFYLAREENCLTKEVLAFARIFIMKEDDLAQLASGPSAPLFQPLSSSEELKKIDEEAASFLKSRLGLLLMAITRPRESPNSQIAAEAQKLLDSHADLLRSTLAVLDSS